MRTLSLFIACAFSISAQYAVADTPSVSSDPEIAKVLMDLNKGEIHAAKLELNHGSNKDAKAFAQMMLKAHEENFDQVKTLSKKDALSPKNSDLSRTLESDAGHLNSDLSKTHNATFDKSYIDEQVTMHQDALKLLNEKLIPNAKNGDLKKLLEATRETVTQHLNHARDVQNKIYKSSL